MSKSRRKGKTRNRRSAAGDGPPHGSVVSQRWLTVAVFAVALVARLLFWQATPDRAWPHSALYKGDAIVWTDYATALERGESFEAGLPLRPPGNAYLLRWLGVEGRAGAGGAKLFWCLLGAAVAAVFYRAALAAFGPAVALGVGLWSALSTGLLMLSTSLNNETPYLLLVGLILLAAPRLAAKPSAGLLLVWGSLHGLACLVRVEHVLFALAAMLWLGVMCWRERNGGRRMIEKPARQAAPVGIGAALRAGIGVPPGRAAAQLARGAAPIARIAVPLALGFGAILAPWHLDAWRTIRDFNEEERPLSPAAESAQRSIEGATAGLRRTPEAVEERDRLPAFARRASANFVAATVLVRGGREVRGEDFAILEEAFGSRPGPLAARPFVALYGPLNFYLANRPGAPPGFDPDGLDRPPPLEGGIDRYPRVLLAGLPPPGLNFSYPPHVEMVTDGYRLGWRWIRGHPGEFLRRAGARLDLASSGAALGWTGRGLPWGLAGERRAVDLTVPRGAGFAVWRLALLGLCVAGIWFGRRQPALLLWLLFAAGKAVAVVAFFGYARQGATLIPVVAALAALAVTGLAARRGAVEPRGRAPRVAVGTEPRRQAPCDAAGTRPRGRAPRPAAGTEPRRRALRVAAAVALVGLGIEAQRSLSPPRIRIDGREVTARDPLPADEHRDRQVRIGD